jgi:hypothetical protein
MISCNRSRNFQKTGAEAETNNYRLHNTDKEII